MNHPESLYRKQVWFAGMVSQLIARAFEMGYEVTLGEAYRSPEEDARLAKAGRGIWKNLHGQSLAIDLNLFRNGVYLTRTEDHKPLGEWWESIGGAWGGRFGAGNHYSLAHEGRK